MGQGISVTPIQQVTAVSAVVNGGYLYKPYIVKSKYKFMLFYINCQANIKI